MLTAAPHRKQVGDQISAATYRQLQAQKGKAAAK
jgi:hypothetical protein